MTVSALSIDFPDLSAIGRDVLKFTNKYGKYCGDLDSTWIPPQQLRAAVNSLCSPGANENKIQVGRLCSGSDLLVMEPQGRTSDSVTLSHYSLYDDRNETKTKPGSTHAKFFQISLFQDVDSRLNSKVPTLGQYGHKYYLVDGRAHVWGRT
jgi:hypothetical protein